MSKKLVLLFFIQIIGPGLLFLLSLSITHFGGMASQGVFSSGKAWYDLLVSLGVFGLPQSIIVAINRRSASPAYLYRATRWYVMGLVPFYAIAGVMFLDKNPDGGGIGHLV